MGTASMQSVAFQMPGGEGCETSGKRPIDLFVEVTEDLTIDLDHLARQTFGDRELEAEVLTMFCHQAKSVADRMAGADEKTRVTLAHTLKGSARGVGATALAGIAERLESAPGDARLIGSLRSETVRVCDFIATITRC